MRGILLAASLLASTTAAGAPALVTERASVSSAGVPANGSSDAAAISGDGRHVAFESIATNLAAGDANGAYDVFVHDRATGATRLASPGLGGAPGDGGSGNPAISRDGRRVAFDSAAANLVPGDTNAKRDVFVRDLGAGTTARASVGPGGRQTFGDSRLAAISATGRFVVFASRGRNLPAAPVTGRDNLYVRDLAAGTTTFGAPSDSGVGAGITPDGHHLAFASEVPGIVPGHPAGRQTDVYLRDRRSGAVSLVSVARGGGFPDGSSFGPYISDDGRTVAFTSNATNLTAGGSPGGGVFVRDLGAGATTELLAPDGGRPDGFTEVRGLSADGRRVLLLSFATNLVPGDTNGEPDLFVQDRRTRRTTRVNVGTAGAQANAPTFSGALSADGRAVAFDSESTNLVPGSIPGRIEVLVRAPAAR